jgi:ribokinase
MMDPEVTFMGTANPIVVVVGAVNVDLTAAVARRPGGGETVLATGLQRRPGGKGANQAAAAARAGAAVWLIGAVGADPDGAGQIAELDRAGVATAYVRAIEGVPTGAAFISVTPDGENSIIVAAGANSELRPEDVTSALASIAAEGAIAVLQSEVPGPVIDAAAHACVQRGTRFVLNNGPVAILHAATLVAADPIVVNEHEASELCGPHPALNRRELAREVRAATGARSVIVTLGADGALLAAAEHDAAIPAPAAHVVDTTGAGDAFVGTLATRLALGDDLGAAASKAVYAATTAVTWPGARPDSDSAMGAMPMPAEARA